MITSPLSLRETEASHTEGVSRQRLLNALRMVARMPPLQSDASATHAAQEESPGGVRVTWRSMLLVTT